MSRFSKLPDSLTKFSVLRWLCSKNEAAYLPQTDIQKRAFLSGSDSEFIGVCARYLLGDNPENDVYERLEKQLVTNPDRAAFFRGLFRSRDAFVHRNQKRLSLPSEAAYPFQGPVGPQKRILVVSNCQTLGLAHCLSLHCESVLVESCDMWTFRKQSKYWHRRIEAFDHIFASQGPELDSIIDFTRQPKTHLIPGFHMESYHKDLTYCWQGETRIKTALDDYHSKICLTAYRMGKSEAETIKLFNADTYRALGYLSQWDRDREAFIGTYQAYGLEVRPLFLNWARHGMVPHSVNHPSIGMLSDLGRLMAQKAGLPVLEHSLLPHDNLANGPIFPVYPEIATELGLTNGAYRFKAANQYTTLSLEEFVHGSFQKYGTLRSEALRFTELDQRSKEYLGGLL